MTTNTRERLAGLAGTRNHEDLPHGCSRCPNRWSGTKTAHCGGCHITTTGISTYDTHRPNGHCVDPTTVGLVLIPGRAYDVWGTTAGEVNGDE